MKLIHTEESELPDPIEAIKFRMEQYSHSNRDMASITGISESHVSEILNRKRKLSLNQIRRLYEYGIPLKVLIQEYKL